VRELDALIMQTAIVTGDRNALTQIAGSGNVLR
jgi:hypothetical protein